MITITKIKENELVKLVENSGVEIQTANEVTENYQKYFLELSEIQEKAVKAPEKTKLKAWLYEISMPFVDESNLSENAKNIKEEIRVKFLGFKTWAENKIKSL